MLNVLQKNRYVSQCIIVGTLIISPVISCIAWFCMGNYVNRRVFVFAIGVLFAFAAYFYTPADDMDLNFYYEAFESSGGLLGKYINAQGEFSRADFILVVIFFLLSKLGVATHFIGALFAFIYFSCLGLIAYNWAQYISYKRRILLFTFLLLSEYLLGFTGLRYDNAVLLYILSLQYFIQKSYYKAWCLAFLSGLLHFSLLPLIAVLLISFIANNKLYKISFYFFLIGSVCLIPIMLFLQNQISSLGPLGNALSNAIDSYVFSEDGSVLWAGSRFWPLQRLFSFILMLCLLGYLYIKRIPLDKIAEKLNRFAILFMAYIFFVISVPQLFMRGLLICNFLFVLFNSYLLYRNQLNSKMEQRLSVILIVYLLLGIFASISGREFKDLFFHLDFLTVSPILILINS